MTWHWRSVEHAHPEGERGEPFTDEGGKSLAEKRFAPEVPNFEGPLFARQVRAWLMGSRYGVKLNGLEPRL